LLPSIDSFASCYIIVGIGIKDQSLALSAEEASKESAQETFGCLQITMMSLTLHI
jgi:hypothetical protein